MCKIYTIGDIADQAEIDIIASQLQKSAPLQKYSQCNPASCAFMVPTLPDRQNA